METWQLLQQEQRLKLLYNVLKALLGFLGVVVASEYFSTAMTTTLGGSLAIHYGVATSIFILGAVALREGARWLMAFLLTEVYRRLPLSEQGPETPTKRA